jgi:hypothetical protein
VCAGCGALVGAYVGGDVDSGCIAAMNHIKDCDGRFMDAPQAMCVTTGHSAAPINASQQRCIQSSSCAEVSRALDSGGYLCGYGLIARRDSSSEPQMKAYKPDEKGD